jgi:hypothetical protein
LRPTIKARRIITVIRDSKMGAPKYSVLRNNSVKVMVNSIGSLAPVDDES